MIVGVRSLCGCLFMPTGYLGQKQAALFRARIRAHHFKRSKCLRKAKQDPVWQARMSTER